MASVNHTSGTVVNSAISNSSCSSRSGSRGLHLNFTPRLSWTIQQQGVILSAYFYGYLVTSIPGAIMCQLIGPRVTMMISLAGGTLFVFLIIISSYAQAYYAYILITCCRVTMGLFCGPLYPAVHGLLASWVPTEERTILVALTHTGNIVGLIFTYSLGSLIDRSEKGWEFFLYFSVGLGVLSLCLWILFVYDKPWLHPRISNAEKIKIMKSLYPNGITKADTFKNIPFKSIILSPAVIATSLAHTANNFILYMFLTNHPNYLQTVYGLSAKIASLISIIPFCVNFCFQIIASSATQSLIRKYHNQPTALFRKIDGFIGFILSASFLIPAGFMGCDGMIWAEVFLSLSMGMLAFNNSGFFTAMIDLSPKYSGLIMGISNAVSSISGFISPLIVSEFTSKKGYIEGWKYSFITTSCIVVFLGTIWLIFGKSEKQPWDEHIRKHKGISTHSGEALKL